MKSVRIGPHIYPIIYVEKVDEEDSWGHYSQAKQTIELANALLPPGSKWAEILLHEISHGIIDNMDAEFPSEEAEERATRKFALGLTQVLKDNKTLFRAILKALK
jgi:hypothetical protein